VSEHRNAPPTVARGASKVLAQDVLIALVGRPNSGKSSLFNRLTGGDAHVGNFPGVTVDILEGGATTPTGIRAAIADLPGLYSIEATVDPETDEGVAQRFLRDALASSRPFGVVQVIDATQLALGLRLTRELSRVQAPLLLVVTQSDVLEAQGACVDASALEDALGVPVVVVSARDSATRHRVLDAIEALMATAAALSIRSARAELSSDAIRSLAKRAIRAPAAGSIDARAERRRTFTTRADAWLLHPIAGPVLFVGIMAALFSAVFLVADPVTALLDAMKQSLSDALGHLLGTGLLASFVTDGLLGGAGTVLAFMPQIVVLTVAMELLDATGYLSRGAFLVDRLLRILGLSGRSFVPLLMAHACAIPAISATRIVRDPRERLTTILVIPLITCSARLPTYALVLGTFFATYNAFQKSLVFLSLYFAGIASALVASLVLRRTATRGRGLPLVLEMPAYRAPEPRVIARKALQSAQRFLRDVGTTIVAVSAILWVLLSVPVRSSTHTSIEFADANRATADAHASIDDTPIERSIAAFVGHALEPLTAPLGFDWRINVGLIGSFGAREVMVSTMGVIFGMQNAGEHPEPLAQRLRDATLADGSKAYSTRTGLALLAFFVLACQCVSTVAAIRRETNTIRWPAFVLGYTYALAYVAAFVVYNFAGFLGMR
jgi:ferrous iron transport protein B